MLDRGAIELCARKVASATGDARKALELCRKAVEVVQREAMRQYQALHSYGKYVYYIYINKWRIILKNVIETFRMEQIDF